MNQSEFATALENLTALEERGEVIQPGSFVGVFRIEAELGRGGMGVVFRAEQDQPIRRKVALKLIQQKLKGSVAEALFEIERQALADMDHPGIARVFDAGRTAHGYSWLAMEWIDGPSLHDYLHRDTTSVNERLRIFVQLCLGVQHAHEKGLIHRDLKPGNVLMATIDGVLQPKLIDFGLAVTVAAAGTPLTRGGTLSYMSPEQRDLAHRIDVRSDVYSLGVILLRMLTPRATHEALDSLGSQGELSKLFGPKALPPLPEEVTGAGLRQALLGVDPELRWVLAKALRHNPAQRYASARDLAEDILRFRTHQPLASVPDSFAYRARKFLRRNGLAVGLGSLAGLALIVALAASLVGYWRAEAARQRAELEAAKAREIARFVESIITGLDPAYARGMDSQMLRLLVDDAERRVERDLQQPEVRAEIFRILARTRSGLGEDEASVALAKKALRLLPEQGETRRAHWLLQRTVGIYEVEAGQDKEGAQRLGKALQALRDTLPDDDPDVLVARSAYAWYGDYQAGRAQAALSELQAVVPLMVQRLPVDDRELWLAQHRLAIISGEQGEYEAAHTIYRQLSETMTQHLGSDHPLLLSLLNSAAVVYAEQRDYATSTARLKALLPAIERVFGERHPMLISVLVNLSGSLRQSGALQESGPHYRRAYELAHARYGEKNVRSIITAANYGNYLTASGEPEQAEVLQRGALERVLEIVGPEHMVVAQMRLGLAETLIALNQPEEAGALLDQAEAMVKKLAPGSTSDLQKIAETRAKLGGG